MDKKPRSNICTWCIVSIVAVSLLTLWVLFNFRDIDTNVDTPRILPASDLPIITVDNAGQLTQIATFNHDRVNDLVWSLDGSLFAVADSTDVWVYDANTFEVQQQLEVRDPSSLAFSPDSSLLAVGSDTIVQVWEVATGNQLDVFENVGPVADLAFNEDGALLIAISGHQVGLWNNTQNPPLTMLGERSRMPIENIAFSQDGSTLAYIHPTPSYPSTAWIWDVEEETLTSTIWPLSEAVDSIELAPGNVTLAVGRGGRRVAGVWMYFVELWPVKNSFLVPLPLVVILFAGFVLLALYACYRKAPVWLLSGLVIISPILLGIIIWMLRIPIPPEAALASHTGRISSLAFDPDEKILASGSEDRNGLDNTVRLWSIDTGLELVVIREHQSPIQVVAFNPSGSVLASADIEGTVRLWAVQADN